MLNENLKRLRQEKGLSQEELAIRLHVVRQTVSKWEKGLSVPDSEMLIRIAEALETTVSALLDETPQEVREQDTLQTIAAKLELLNEQFAHRNENRRKMWRAVFVILGILALVALVLEIVAFATASIATDASIGIIGGADGPTAIMVATRTGSLPQLILAALVILLCAVGIIRTGRR